MHFYLFWSFVYTLYVCFIHGLANLTSLSGNNFDVPPLNRKGVVGFHLAADAPWSMQGIFADVWDWAGRHANE